MQLLPALNTDPVPLRLWFPLSSRRILAKYLVLATERKPTQPAFGKAQPAQLPWEVEQRIGAQKLEPGFRQNLVRLTRADRNRILIKSALRHHISRARIPRVVLPKSKQAPGTKSATNGHQTLSALARRYVVENAIGKAKIHRAVGRPLVAAEERH